ncbi:MULTISPECIES: hypothetical protein [unclassified Streptomyces]|uniref:hypothetical protein n=1 Tax=unclassified Streptomyces TaxID=2593676 RepID=UPI002DDA4AF7|nr:hypothetical protein [Streptomyces sp. NBC_00243]WRZ20709.1 hypothetical protein OHT59_20450 [Streptomyces sp. NBC_00243]
MRSNAPRTAHPLIVLALFTAAAVGAVAGCGSEKAGGSPPQSGARARQVAEAWDGSQAAEVWRKGYYPMGESVQLPDGAFRNEDDKLAYMTQNFVLRGKLPAASPKEGKVEWKSGGSLTLPLTGARAAYETVARGGGDGPHLTVTGAKLGEMSLATSRGPATVPAWLFTLDGYDTPLKQVALSPSKLPKPPIKPARETPTNHLMPLDRLAEVADDGRSVTVVANHGSCDDGPAVAVLETDGSVVLSASVVGTKDGACTADLHAKKVTVKLDRVVGDRLLLDAFTGRPVPYGHPDGSSPSWS